MRPDGRRADEMRPVRIRRQYTKYAEGSVLVEFGGTRVVCTASVEERIPPFLRGQGRGWVTAEYGMLPRSTSERMRREAAGGKQSGRTLEIQRLIGRSLRAAVDLKKLGERTVHVDCDVIQADGGTRTASVTGGFVALADALGWLQTNGALAAPALKGAVAAVSVGMVDGQARLDLDYAEDSDCDTDLNLVMTEAGGVIEIQGTAEGEPLDRAQLTALLDLGELGIRRLFELQHAALAAAPARDRP